MITLVQASVKKEIAHRKIGATLRPHYDRGIEP